METTAKILSIENTISMNSTAKTVVEKEDPELIGGLGDYFLDKNGYFTKHMIHFDTRGYRHRYPK